MKSASDPDGASGFLIGWYGADSCSYFVGSFAAEASSSRSSSGSRSLKAMCRVLASPLHNECLSDSRNEVDLCSRNAKVTESDASSADVLACIDRGGLAYISLPIDGLLGNQNLVQTDETSKLTQSVSAICEAKS